MALPESVLVDFFSVQPLCFLCLCVFKPATVLETQRPEETQRRNLFPKPQEQEQPDPQSVHRVPVQRNDLRRDFSLLRQWGSIASHSHEQVQQRSDSTKQVHAMHSGKKIEERAVRIARKENSLRSKFAPAEKLAGKKNYSQRES